MKIYASFKEFLSHIGRHLIYSRQRTSQETAKKKTQKLREIRQRMKENGLTVHVTKSPPYGFKATLRDADNGLYIGHGINKFDAIEEALGSDMFVYPAKKRVPVQTMEESVRS